MGLIHGKRVLVTGGSGFLGKAVCQTLKQFKPSQILVPRSKDFDLREKEGVQNALDHFNPDLIIHLAAVVGGIEANRKNPGSYFYENAIMGILLMEHARRRDVKKFVAVGSICSYPKHTPVPFREEFLWDGYPEETNAPYGLAKKMLLVQAQAYRQQYGFNAISLLPVNLYGPNDNFDPETSHVIPALIRKAVEARNSKLPNIEVWGTGQATREFLFVRDAAEAIVLATDTYNQPEPVNIGSGQEITIRDLTRLICELCGYDGEIQWNSSKPNGQPRRCLDTSRAMRDFDFKATTNFREGLRETIDWYEFHSRTIKESKAA